LLDLILVQASQAATTLPHLGGARIADRHTLARAQHRKKLSG